MKFIFMNCIGKSCRKDHECKCEELERMWKRREDRIVCVGKSSLRFVAGVWELRNVCSWMLYRIRNCTLPSDCR